MRKIFDLENTEANEVRNLLESKSSELGIESYEKSTNERKDYLKDMLGLCFDCENMIYCSTEFGNIIARCDVFKINLHGRERMKDCNMYAKAGSMSLNDMMNIATLIDVEDSTRTRGFITKEKRFKK